MIGKISAFAVYPVVTILTVGFAWLFGFVKMSDFEINTFITLIVFATIGGVVVNIFEEFSWRGYLTPKLLALGLIDGLIYLISGLVWALWHVAYYLVFLPDEVLGSLSRVEYVWTGCHVC